ncbi:MAG: hypothetical protein NC222_07420 [Staphylococcus sp.]|nr:hypothetical protein [Staphylococcus sp.]
MIVMFLQHILKYAGVRVILDGIHRASIGLVLATDVFEFNIQYEDNRK